MESAKALGEIADDEYRACAVLRVAQRGRECGIFGCLALRHGRRFSHTRTKRRNQPPSHADETSRRENDEADEKQTKIKQPVMRPNGEKLTEQDEEHGAERRTEKAAHPADHHHGDELAGKRHGERLGGGEAVIEDRQRSGNPDDNCGEHETDQLVAVGGITEEARALFVFSDCHQYAADRRAVKAP